MLVAARQRHRPLADDRRHARVGRDHGIAERLAEDLRARTLGDVVLDDLDLALGEHVRLHRRADADHPGDRVGRLDLGRDDEVDVELPLAPELDVLDVGGADHGGRLGCLEPRERARDEVRLVARRAGEHEVGVAHARVGQSAPAGAVRLQRRDVEALADRGEAGRIEVENGHVVLAVESLHDRRSHLAGADDEDLHGGRRVQRRGRRRRAIFATVGPNAPPRRPRRRARSRPRRRCVRLRDAATGDGAAPRTVRLRVLEPGPGDGTARLAWRRLRRRAGRSRPRRQGGEGPGGSRSSTCVP